MLATGRLRGGEGPRVEAQRILLLSLPKDAWQVAFAMNAEGAALMKLGDYSGAEPLLLESQKWLPKAQLPGLAERGATGWWRSIPPGASLPKRRNIASTTEAHHCAAAVAISRV